MLVKNLTPFPFGTKAGSRRPPQPDMTVVVKGSFRLTPGVLTALDDQPPLSGETFEEGDDDRAGASALPGDFADFKLNAEVLLQGSCYPPKRERVRECPVRLTVGGWSKTLRVVGRRQIGATGLSEPQPFRKAALGWKNAYGGPGFDRNPVGKGAGSKEAPNLELPGKPFLSRGDVIEPASFAPISSTWAERRKKLGTQYGPSWQKTRAPYFSEDFDWSHFSAGAKDQQLPGFLRGDEAVSLLNLHPEHGFLESKLPGLRVRVFAKDDEGRFREIAMSLDTLFFEPDEDRVSLVWRGVDAVREDDLEDVTHLLVASETLGTEPLPVAHYEGVLEAFIEDPLLLAEAFPPGLLELAERLESDQPADDDPALAGLDPVSRRLKRLLGDFAPEQQAQVQQQIAALMAQKPPAADLSAAAGAPPVDLRAELEKAAASLDEGAPPVPMTHKPGGLPPQGLRRKMRGLLEQADGAEAELDRAAARLAANGQSLPDDARAKIAEMRKIPEDPRWAQLDPGYTYPEPLGTAEPGPGVDLTDRDLSGRDLRGRDLRGAILDGALLSKADLTGADLTGANLRHAVLWKTVLTGAKLDGADLTRANLARARLVGASLRGATLEQAFFRGAILVDADLGEAAGEYAVFVKADLSGLRGHKARLRNADFSEARLERAALVQADLEASILEATRAEGVDLSSANVSRSSFSKSDLTGAVLAGARGERACFLEVTLDRANLELARMREAHFTKSELRGAVLYGADLRLARFYRARLDKADLSRANLFQADLCKASVEGTKMRGAVLFEAKMLGTRGRDLDLTGAVITGIVRDTR